MPQLYEKAVITDGGAALLSKAQAGKIKMEFTRAVIGSGEYSFEEKKLESLGKRTTLKAQQNSYLLSGIEVMPDHIVKVTALVTNQDPVNNTVLVNEGYYINEIGLYAKEQGSSEEMLFCIITAAEKGDYMPAYNGSSPAQIIQDFFITISNTASVEVDVQNGAVALASDVRDIRKTLETKQDCFVSRIDLSGSAYDQSTYYPVTGTPIPKGGLYKIHVYTTFDMDAHPTWATNAAGYTCNMELYDKGQCWGQADGAAICTDYSAKHTSQLPCGYLQMPHTSTPVLTLRGGGIYYVETGYESEWTVQTDVYTYEGDTVRPGTKRTLKFDRATIFADLNGNVAGKVNGYTLGKNVPSDAQLTDTVYTHPLTHAATMITEDTTHRFVTDAEKEQWSKILTFEKQMDNILSYRSIRFNTVEGNYWVESNGEVWKTSYSGMECARIPASQGEMYKIRCDTSIGRPIMGVQILEGETVYIQNVTITRNVDDGYYYCTIGEGVDELYINNNMQGVIEIYKKLEKE